MLPSPVSPPNLVEPCSLIFGMTRKGVSRKVRVINLPRSGKLSCMQECIETQKNQYHVQIREALFLNQLEENIHLLLLSSSSSTFNLLAIVMGQNRSDLIIESTSRESILL